MTPAWTIADHERARWVAFHRGRLARLVRLHTEHAAGCNGTGVRMMRLSILSEYRALKALGAEAEARAVLPALWAVR